MGDRQQTRSTVSKSTPDLADILPREMVYSFVSGELSIRHPTDNTIHVIGGRAVVQRVQTLEQAVGGVNQNPVAQAVAQSLQDTATSVTVNVLTTASDPDGDTMSVSSVSYNSIARTVGTQFNTTYGTFVLNANGVGTFTPNATARALNAAQVATEVISFQITDSRNGLSNTTAITFTINGTNHAPVLVPDGGSIPAGQATTGNILTNDSDPEGQALSVVSFMIGSTTYPAGTTANVAGQFVVTVNANGTFSVTPDNAATGALPVVTCTVTDGTNNRTSLLTFAVQSSAVSYADTIAWFKQYRDGVVQPEQSRIAPNPVTNRSNASFSTSEPVAPWDYKAKLPSRVGVDATNLDFRVGPGKEYTELNQVPWLKLIGGDRVFVYSRGTPYKHVIPVHVRGDSLRWIEIIGVRDPSTGAMPILDGANAIEDGNVCKFNGTHNSMGMIHVIQPLGLSDMAFKPGYIHIHGFEFRNTNAGGALTRYDGAASNWGTLATGIKVMGCDGITVSGCHFHNNTVGMFANSVEGAGERFMTRRLHALFNYFIDNGDIGSPSTHNAYNETVGAIYEFNYFDHNRNGNWGDLIKERSSGQVFRYNYFNNLYNENTISLRDPEGHANSGLTELDTFGRVMSKDSYIYGNTFYVETPFSTVVAHGDGLYSLDYREIRGGGTVYFYHNRVAARAEPTTDWFAGQYYDRIGPTLFEFWNNREITMVTAVNNLLYAEKKSSNGLLGELSMFMFTGVPENWASNYAHNVKPRFFFDGTPTVPSSARYRGTISSATMQTLGLTNSAVDPGFVSFNTGYVELKPSSPYYGLNAALPTAVIQRGLIPEGEPITHPYGEKPKPVELVAASVTGSGLAGGLYTGVIADFAPYPTTSTYQWYLNTGSGLAPIQNATGLTYQSTSGQVGNDLVFAHTATTSGGQTTSYSNPVRLASATTPLCTTNPVASGSGQWGYALNTNTGVWTNNPNSYEYKWQTNQSGSWVDIPGATLATYTPPQSLLGAQVRPVVKAIGALAEYGFGYGNAITIIAQVSDPDGSGKFEFVAAANVSLQDISSKWKGIPTQGYVPSTYYYCDGNGSLIGGNTARWNGGITYYQNGQADDVSVEIRGEIVSGEGELKLALRQTDTQYGYVFQVEPTAVKVHRQNWGANGRDEVASYAHSATGLVTLKVVPEGGAGTGTFKVYLNGTLLNTYVDGSPMTGGYPGLGLWPGSNYATQPARIDYWTDNPQ